MPRSHIYNLNSLLLKLFLFCCCYFFATNAFSADIQAVLDTSDGSSGMVVQDSSNAARMRILSNGNVGINTVSPEGTLEIIKSGSVIPVMVSSSPASRGDYLSVTAAGNVGIGTVGASSKLHINTGVNENLRVRPGTDFLGENGVALQSVNDAGSTLQVMTLRSSDLLLLSTGNVGVGTTTPAGGFVVMNGNVGIGTWAPQSMLEVRGGPARIGSGTVNNATSEGDLYVANNLEVDGNVWLGDAITDNLTVTGRFTQTGATDFDTIEIRNGAYVGTAGGNLGVGTTAASASVEVLKNASNPLLKLSSTVAGSGDLLMVDSAGNVGVGTTTPQGAMVVTAGNVGVGTWSPRMALDVQGNGVRIGNGAFNNASGNGDLYVTGNMEVDGSVWLGDAAADNFTVTGTFIQAGDSSITGNFGIGTTTPQTKLSVLGPVGIGTWTTPQGQLAVIGGNVGIGTMSPSESLDVAGWTRSTMGFRTQGGYTQSGGSLNILTGDTVISGTATFNNATYSALFSGGNVGVGSFTPQGAFTVSSGNVGIGTWAPQSALEVREGLVRIGTGTLNNVSGPGDLYVANNLEVDGSVWLGDAVSDNLTVMGTFSQSGDSNVSGNFGVGTTTPQTKLAILGPVGIGTWTAPEGAMAVMNGNVGIGTMSPSQTLDVAGGVRSQSFTTTGGYTQTGASANTFTGASTFNDNVGIGTSSAQGAFVVGSGNVGVGTWAPRLSLDVQGEGVRIGNGAFNNASGNGDLYVTGNLEVDGSVWLGDAVSDNLTVTGTFSQTGDSSVSGNFGVGTTTPQTKLSILGPVGIGTWTEPQAGMAIMNGNVGVGSMNPSQAVDVTGTVRSTTGFDTLGGYTQSGASTNTLTGATNVSGVATFSNATTSALFTGGNVGVGTSTPQGAFTVTSGNVGVGTWAPAQALDVNGTVKSNAFSTTGGYVQTGASANTFSGVSEFSNNVGIGTTTPQGRLAVLSGNVGIGTWAPQQALEVVGTITATYLVGDGSGISGVTAFPAGNANAVQYGDGLTTLGDETKFSFNGTNVGINTTNGVAALDVRGTVYSSGNVGIGTSTPQGGLVVTRGNVGIGTWAPAASLEVVGNINIKSGASTGQISSNGSGVLLLNPSNVAGVNVYGQLAPSTNNMALGSVSNRWNAFMTSADISGNVGIGTSLPVEKLTINGGVGIGTAFSSFVTTRAPDGGMIVEGNVGVGSTAPGAKLDVNGTVRATAFSGDGTNITGVLAFPAGDANAVQYGDGLSTLGDETKFSFNGTNVGINTTNGLAALDVRGDVYTAGNIGVGTTTAQGSLVVTSGNVGIGTWAPVSLLDVNRSFNVLSGGNVGIGTTIPAYQFQVSGSSAITRGGFFNTGAGSSAVMVFVSNPAFDAFTDYWGGSSSARWAVGVDGSTQKFGIAINAVGSATPFGSQAFTIDTFGNVGVGTTVPAEKLTINGGVGIGTAFSSFVTTRAPDGGMIVEGNVGVGSTAPGAKVDVNGTVRATAFSGDGTNITGVLAFPAGDANAVQYGDGLSTLGDETKFSFNGTNVGINTTNGLAALDVRGIVSMSGNVGIGTTTPQGALVVTNGNVGLGTIDPRFNLDVYGNAFVRSNLFANTMSSSLGNNLKIYSNNASNLGLSVISGTGYVGLGTTIAGSRLSINGGVGIGTGTSEYIQALAPSGGMIVQGNVGIATTLPGTALDVNGTVRATAFSGDGTNVTGVLAFPAGGENAVQYGDGLSTLGDETKLSFNGTNVGINTTNGLAALDVRGDVYTMGNIGVGTTTAQGSLVVTTGNVGIGTWAPVSLLDVDQKFNVQSSGNVGIGTITPGGALTVMNGNVGIGTWNPASILQIGSAAGANLRFTSGASSSLLSYNGVFNLGTLNSTAFNLLTGAITRMTVDGTSGNIGISTTSTQAKLAVLGNVGIGTWTADGGNLIVKGDGNVGVGTAWPGTAVDVVGTVRATAFVGSGAGITGVSASPAGGANAVQYGNGVVTTGDESKFSFDGTNVGINTTNGVAALDVRGDVYTTGNIGVGTTTPLGALSVMSGNVGIGTWVPSATLDVGGGDGAVTFKLTSSVANTYLSFSNTAITMNRQSSSNSVLGINTSNSGAWGSNETAGAISFNNKMYVLRGGNVGIGTMSPVGGLTVMNGNVGIGTWVPAAALDVVGSLTVRGGGDIYATGGNIQVAGGYGVRNAGDHLKLLTTTDKDTIFMTSSSTETMRVTTSGNVGIGTSLPVEKLTINGGVGIGTAFSSFVTTRAPDGGMIVEGNVGIATTAPGTKLDVVGTVRATAFSGDGTNVTGVLAFPAGGENAVQYGDGLSTLGDETKLSFNGANVGIGTTNGAAMLDVRGNVYTTGNIGVGTTTPQAGLVVTGSNIGIGTWTAEGGNLIVNGGGNVGIGSAWPGQSLDVQGDTRISGNVEINLQ